MSEFFQTYGAMLLSETWATLFMTLTATTLAYVLGLPIGILVVITNEHSIWPHRTLNRIVGWIVNIGRSIPFIILLVVLIPFTRFVVGTPLGAKAAIVPLVIASTPFVARMVESSIQELNSGVIEAAQSTGASVFQIVWKVMIPESLPSLILGASITCITLFGYSAIAGVVGAGGLGDVAIRYGYHRYQKDVMYVTLIILIIVVQVIQTLGSGLSRRLDKRIKK